MANLNDVITKEIDFNVEQVPSFIQYNGKTVQTNEFVTVRTDTGMPISSVGSRYQVLDHKKAILVAAEALNRITQDWSVTHRVETGRIYSRFTINNEDLMPTVRSEGAKLALEVKNSYDGSQSFGIDFSVWRKICSNGMMGFAREAGIRRVHTASLEVNDRLVKGIVTAMQNTKEKYETFYRTLSEKPVISKEVLETVFTDKLIKLARQGYRTERSFVGTDSAWTQYNSFTRAITHDEGTSESHKQNLSIILSNLFLSQSAISK
jgi:hypothetical protein